MKLKILPNFMLILTTNMYRQSLQHTSKKTKRLAQWSQKVMFVCCDWWIAIHFSSVHFFASQLVVTLLMIDGNKTPKSFVGLQVQSPYLIERHSKQSSLIEESLQSVSQKDIFIYEKKSSIYKSKYSVRVNTRHIHPITQDLKGHLHTGNCPHH